MTSLELHCIALWRLAADAATGLIIATNDPARARITMYNARKLCGDSDFDNLMIRVSPDDSEHQIWIIHNASQLLDLSNA